MDFLEFCFHVAVQVPVAIVTTLAAVRLLGVRRSWVATVEAGLTGWVGANLLLVGLNDWDWDEAQLSLTLLAVAFGFTLIAALVIDLFAPLGTLARGERAGLFVMPQPLKELRRQILPYARSRQVLGIARRNGLVTRRRAADWADQPAVAIGVRKTLEEAGVVFVKVGQMASTRPDLLPEHLRTELSALQSSVAPEPPAVMRQQLEAELGQPIDEVFAAFDWAPIGTASIAQAYGARLHTGEAVVVKIQRPGMDEIVERDAAVLIHFARLLERNTPQGRALHLESAASEFAENLRHELDFIREGASAIDLAAANDPESGVRIPHVYRQYLTRRVLVEERFEGSSVADRALALDDEALADRLVHALFRQMFTHGHFHADPHPGNVMLLTDGSLGLIDFGSTGRVDAHQRQALVDMTAAAMAGDGAGMLDAVEQIAQVGPNARDGALERALDRFVADNVRPGASIDITALSRLTPLLAQYDVQLPREMTAVIRALALLDGTARTICADYSLTDGLRRMLALGRPAASDLSFKDQFVRELTQQLPRLRRLPAQLDRIVSKTARGELRHQVVLFATDDDARVVTTLVNRLVLALVGGLVFAGSALLLSVSSGLMIGETPITHVFGFLGLGIASVLLLRLVAAIVRDGYN